MVDYADTATEFRAGRVITRSFGTFFRNIMPFGLIALAVTSPTYIYMLLTGAGDMSLTADPYADPMDGLGEQLAITLVQMILGYLVTAALVYGTIRSLKNDPASINECFSRGLSLMFPVMGVAIVSTLIMALALLALIIPGIWVMTVLWVVVPVAVMERRGFGSLSRSAQLTSGYRWRLLFLLLLLLAVFFGIGMVVGGVTAGITFGSINDAGDVSAGGVTGIVLLQWVFGSLMSALGAVISAVSYHDLRVAKEGVDTDQIASVFD